MKITHAPRGESGPSYEVEADRHGNYTIRLEGKVLRRVTSVTSYVGKPRWGSKKLEQAAIEEAKSAIDKHDTAG